MGQQRPFLRMGVFAWDNVFDDHAFGIQQRQALTRQGTGCRPPQDTHTMFGLTQVIAVKDAHAVSLEKRLATAFHAIYQLACLLGRMLYQACDVHGST